MDGVKTLRLLADGGALPRVAMRWALDNWSEAAPRLLSRLSAFEEQGSRFDAGGLEAFYITHLCGERRETRAHAPLCRMIASRPDIGEWLGDAVTETLPGILIGTFDGDAKLLKLAIEAPVGYDFARASALAALGYLARANDVVGDDDMRDYLRRIRIGMQPRGCSIVWMAWAATAANLGYLDLRRDVERLIANEFIPGREFNVETFDRQVALARRDRAGLAGFETDLVSPLRDAIGALEYLSALSDGSVRIWDVFQRIVAPKSLTAAVRPLRVWRDA
jgi:hypothetical protein